MLPPALPPANLVALINSLRPPQGKRRRGWRAHTRMAVKDGGIRILDRVKLQGFKGRP